MRAVRLQDVAEYAGVSMKTVSNVVRGAPNVSPGMRSRVQTAIDELGYRPNVMGRRLATGRTGLIALAFNTVGLPYFAELASRVGAHAAKRGYRVLIQETNARRSSEENVVSGPETGLVDGTIFQPSVLTSSDLSKVRGGPPLVLLGEGPAPLTIDHVMVDNVAAAREVTEHLIASGRRRIGFVGHESGELSETSRQRIAGYQEALEAAGIRPDPRLMVATPSVSSGAAVDAVGLALGSGLEVDALVCRDDLAALGTLRALYLRGERVPEAVAVTGWDNIPVSANLCPSLTTVAPDLDDLAAHATRLLFERIDGYAGTGRHVLAPHSIELRESAP